MSPKNAHTLDCSNCGAPLDFDGTREVIRCKYCLNFTVVPGELLVNEPGITDRSDTYLTEIRNLVLSGHKKEAIKRYRETFDTSLVKAQHAVETIEAELTGQKVPAPLKSPHTPSDQKARQTGSAGWIGSLILVIVLLVIGGVAAFALFLPGGPFRPRMIALDPSILLPIEGPELPDVITLLYNIDDDQRLIGRIDTDSGDLIWQSEPLPGSGFADALLGSGETIYVAVEADLMALRASDGALLWRIEMPDRLDYGQDCMVLEGDQIVTMTLDRTLQAYAASSGKLLWSRRLESYDRQIRQINGRLAVLDYVGDSYDYTLFFIDPVDGSEEFSFTPICRYAGWTEGLDTGSGIVYDSSEQALYSIFGDYAGCVQRYDIVNQDISWQITIEEGFDYDDFTNVMTESHLYIGDESRIWVVEKGTSSIHLLVEVEDYDLIPLANTEDKLILRVRRTRGSERFELWCLDAVTGEILWELDLADGVPIDPPDEMVGLIDDDESGWTWQLRPDGLLLVEFLADPNTLLLRTFDLLDGSIVRETEIPLKHISGDFYSIPTVIGWWGDNVYLNVDANIYLLDLATSGLKLLFP